MKKEERSIRGAGGIFVLFHALFCMVYFGALVSRGIWSEPALLAIGVSLVLFLCGITVYGVFGFAVKYDNYAMMAGYDPKVQYNPEGMAVFLRQVMLHISISSLFFSCLLMALSIPYIKPGSELDGEAYGLLIVTPAVILYTVEFAAVILISRHRNRDNLYLK